MHEAIIILSVHREQGLLKAENLVDVLNAVRPEAIFLEHSPFEYEGFNGLEKKAVDLYLVKDRVPVFPSGMSFSGKDVLIFNQKYQQLSRVFEMYSSEDYRTKYDKHMQRISLEGFSYLHGRECALIQKWIHEEEAKMAASSGHQEIYQIFQLWSELQLNRESFILEYIEKTVLEKGYKRVALLIGAAHRNSFLDLAKKSGCREIEWSCYGF